MTAERSEGLLIKAQPLEQAERISNLMVEVQVVDGALLLDADPAWAGAINTVLIKKGVRVNELCPTRQRMSAQPQFKRSHKATERRFKGGDKQEGRPERCMQARNSMRCRIARFGSKCLPSGWPSAEDRRWRRSAGFPCVLGWRRLFALAIASRLALSSSEEGA